MKQKIDIIVDMTDEVDNSMLVTAHDNDTLSIHGLNCPATIWMTRAQAFCLKTLLEEYFDEVQIKDDTRFPDSSRTG